MAVTQWTPQMVEQIRQGFLNGLEIKNMAIAVGKTPCAVNKALSRFGIRRADNLLAFRAKNKQVANVPKQPSKIGIDQWFRKFLNAEMEKWVAFDEVLRYLNKHNIKVLSLNSSSLKLLNRKFLVGSKQCSPLQILLIANKLRSEQNQRAFFVKNLSW